MGDLLNALADNINVVVIIFFGLLFAVFALFSIERAAYKAYLMLMVRARWFPEGRFALTCTTGDTRWDSYLSDVLLPDMGEYTVVVDARDLHAAGGLERRLIDKFMENAALEPEVIVFLPYFEFKSFMFGEAVRTEGEYGDKMLAKQREKLMDVVDEQIDRVRLYI